jgi:hypothetical protein
LLTRIFARSLFCFLCWEILRHTAGNRTRVAEPGIEPYIALLLNIRLYH